MSESVRYRAALDCSRNTAVFAVARNEEILLEKALPMTGHDASALAEWVRSSLAERDLSADSVSEWTVGVGPGSFSGLRIASAFVMGMTYAQKNVRIRGMMSAAAQVCAVFPDPASRPEHVLALYDGRRSEVLAYGIEWKDGILKPDSFTAVIARPEDLLPLQEHYAFCALECDRKAVERFSQNVRYAETLQPSALIFNDPDNFSVKATDLIYLRAAVFVDPKTPRKII